LFSINFCSAGSDQALVLPQREFNPNSGFENLLAKNGWRKIPENVFLLD